MTIQNEIKYSKPLGSSTKRIDLIVDGGNIVKSKDKAIMTEKVFKENTLAALEKIEASEIDSAIDEVKCQIQEFYKQGYEIGLHLHPQWCNAQYHHGRWYLDYSEYNLCNWIQQIVDPQHPLSVVYRIDDNCRFSGKPGKNDIQQIHDIVTVWNYPG